MPTIDLRARGLRGVLRRLDGDLRGALACLASVANAAGLEIGQLREALAVERDPGVLQAADHLAVGQPVFARRGVDPHHPQAAEVALLAAAADEGVLERGVDRFFRGPIQLALVGVIALGELQQFLALGSADRSSFYTRHSRSPEISDFRFQISDWISDSSLKSATLNSEISVSLIRQHPRDLRHVDRRHRRRALEPALPLPGLAGQDVLA